VHIFRVHAEVEEIFLREAHVLEQLPQTMVESGNACPPPVGGQAFDRFVESDVRFFPIKDAYEVRAKRIG
jgi:hypothetical protein